MGARSSPGPSVLRLHTRPLTQHPLQFQAQSHPGLASRCMPAVKLQSNPKPLTFPRSRRGPNVNSQSSLLTQRARCPARRPPQSIRIEPPPPQNGGSLAARPVACTVTAARTHAHRPAQSCAPQPARGRSHTWRARPRPTERAHAAAARARWSPRSRGPLVAVRSQVPVAPTMQLLETQRELGRQGHQVSGTAGPERGPP